MDLLELLAVLSSGPRDGKPSASDIERALPVWEKAAGLLNVELEDVEGSLRISVRLNGQHRTPGSRGKRSDSSSRRAVASTRFVALAGISEPQRGW